MMTIMIRYITLLLCALCIALCAATASAADAGPRDGKYRIMSYGRVGNPPIYLGAVVLSGHKYKAYLPGDKPAGEGEWTYDAAQQRVIWKSGPYKDQWDGKFEVDRGGKTHKIRLKSTTIATNSVD
ncbi:MAG TPA: hypothetical protein VFC24_19025 [Casimicrobiaceae bacterium]|nr:hypothetical protein [Casimicrobiaceae bacterium]